MKAEYLNMYAEVVAAYQNLYQKLQELPQPTTLIDRVDSAFAMREMESRIDDLRKEFKKSKENHERLANMQHSMNYLQGSADEKVKTDFCTAECHTSVSITPPKPGSAEYFLLMSHLFVPQQLIEHDVVRPHYPGMSNYVTLLTQGGWPLPPGVESEKEHTFYGLKMCKNRGVSLL